MICDPAKLDDRACIGAPDILVEILSPSNNKKVLKNKYEVYEERGMKKYWVVSAQDRTFLAYILNGQATYTPTRLMVGATSIERPYGEILNLIWKRFLKIKFPL